MYRFLALLVLSLGLLLGWCDPAKAQSSEELAEALRPFLIEALPTILYEQEDNWGQQRPAPNGIKWKGIRPRITKGMRNDGTWRKVRITTRDLPRTLELHLSEFTRVDADRQSFRVYLAFQTGVEFEQQVWESGVRLWSGSVRARLRLKLVLDCENLIRVERAANGLPEFVFRLRVTQADVSYDHMVVEHLPGFGGSAARLIGEALRSGLKQWKPSLERNLMERANTAIVRAADTREVRIGLSGLVKN